MPSSLERGVAMVTSHAATHPVSRLITMRSGSIASSQFATIDPIWAVFAAGCGCRALICMAYTALNNTWYPPMSDIVQWIVALMLPLVLAGMAFGQAVFLLPVAATIGVFQGLTASAPYASNAFQTGIGLALALCVIAMLSGLRFRRHVLGKIMTSLGIYGWCLVGLVGFGPQ